MLTMLEMNEQYEYSMRMAEIRATKQAIFLHDMAKASGFRNLQEWLTRDRPAFDKACEYFDKAYKAYADQPDKIAHACRVFLGAHRLV